MTERRVREVWVPRHLPKIRNVGVYCRVGTASTEQLHSLANQVSHFTLLIKRKVGWRLHDFCIDVASGATTEKRLEFQRMMDDCENSVVNTVITKSISRFGRNTEQALISLRLLTSFNVESSSNLRASTHPKPTAN